MIFQKLALDFGGGGWVGGGGGGGMMEQPLPVIQ